MFVVVFRISHELNDGWPCFQLFQLTTISETKATHIFAVYTITTIFPDYNTYYFHRASTPFPLKRSPLLPILIFQISTTDLLKL
jgi:hypothetical protein